MPSVNIGGVSISVAISNISAVKLNENLPPGEITFDVGAKLEEKERRTGEVTVVFVLTVGTKPNLVKFGIEGLATMRGKESEIEKMMEIDPNTKIPKVLHGVYQHVFMAIYLVSTILNSPHPPPDLFYSSKQPISKVELSGATAAEENEEAVTKQIGEEMEETAEESTEPEQ